MEAEKEIIKLNKKLHDEICSDDCSLEEIKRLLSAGADPLGSFGEYPDDHLLGEVIYDACNDEKLAERLPQIIQLCVKEFTIPYESAKAFRKMRGEMLRPNQYTELKVKVFM